MLDLVAAGFAGFVSVLVTQPTDFLKTKMMGIDGHKYRGMFDCIRQVYYTQGITGFYRGFGTRLTRDTFAVALIFTFFHQIRDAIASHS